MRIKRSKLSSYKLKKIITHFVVDINASKTSLLTGINRNTVNRFYHIFRKVIYQEQLQLFKEKLHKTTVECDEAYFGGKRKRVFLVNEDEVPINNQYLVYLKETEKYIRKSLITVLSLLYRLLSEVELILKP